MNADDRLDLEDLLPANMILWGDDDELGGWPDDPWTWKKWRDVLGHPKAHPGCCRTCGCATSCLLTVFYSSVVTSVIRELDALGLLRSGKEDGV